jgi:type VI secretion system protein ImpK
MDDSSKTQLMRTLPGQVPEAGIGTAWQATPGRRHSSDALRHLLHTDLSATVHPNPVMASAAPLLLLLAALHESPASTPTAEFERALIRAIHQFDHQAIARGISGDHANAARYIICTAIDEAIMATAWGQHSAWSSRSLLQRFHNETNGGDRFFTLLDSLLMRQHLFGDLLQLCHFCLSLGFAGRLHLDPQGHFKREALCRQIHYALMQQGHGGAQHSILLKADDITPAPPQRRISGRAIVLVALALYAGLFGIMRWNLNITSDRTSAWMIATAAVGNMPSPRSPQ